MLHRIQYFHLYTSRIIYELCNINLILHYKVSVAFIISYINYI